MDHPGCRLHLDVRALCAESRPPADTIRAHPDFVHFHANDPNLGGPGSGDVDYGPILAALHEIGYGGWISVEVFDTAPDGVTVARRSLEYLTSAWARGPGRR